MKIRIKNNRLFLECQVKNLNDIPEQKLREVAAKYQIGWSKLSPVDIATNMDGTARISREQIVAAKPRKMLEDEIRKYLSISLIVPKEYWTEEQQNAFMTNSLSEEKDIQREVEIKKSVKIQQDLPPYEETKDKYKEVMMFAELNETQWDYFKQYYNSKINLKKDEEGRTIGKEIKNVNRLMVEEYLPENDEDEERVKTMEAAKLARKKVKDDEES